MLEPIVKTIEVPCGQKMAFDVFLSEMDSWWPTTKFSVSAHSKQAAKSLRVDPVLGGKIVEIGHDDTEHLWGTITAYDPHGAFSMDFHIGQEAASASQVAVQFSVVDAQRTRVQLTQTGWENAGEMAPMLHHGYTMGWAVIFDQEYMKACGGLPVG